MEKLPWVIEIEKLRAFREEVRRLVKKADDELATGLVLLPLQDLLLGLKDALDTKPTRYEKTYRNGCSGLEECGADRGRVLD